RVLESSTAPLRVKDKSGAMRPVDLHLRRVEAGFAAGNPIEPVAVASHLAGGVTAGSSAIHVTPEGNDVSGNLIDGQSVAFANIGTDEDAMATPTIDGVELFTSLRSRLSPEQIAYRVSLPSGASLAADADGGAVISRGRTTLAKLPAPSAQDAQGVDVPVQMR